MLLRRVRAFYVSDVGDVDDVGDVRRRQPELTTPISALYTRNAIKPVLYNSYDGFVPDNDSLPVALTSG